MADSGLEEDDAREARVDVEVRYPSTEPALGMMGGELLEIDRGVREAIRQARRDEPPKGREGWPSPRDSVTVVRAETRSPLSVEATGYFIGLLSSLSATALVLLIKKTIGDRLATRSPVRPPIEIVLRVQIQDQGAEDRLGFGDWDWPADCDQTSNGASTR